MGKSHCYECQSFWGPESRNAALTLVLQALSPEAIDQDLRLSSILLSMASAERSLAGGRRRSRSVPGP